MSDPRYQHRYEPRRADGKCKIYVGGGYICGLGEDALVHTRQRMYDEQHREPPELDRDEVLAALRQFVHGIDWDGTNHDAEAYIRREMATVILEENEIYG